MENGMVLAKPAALSASLLPFEQGTEFLLKELLAVMHLLAGDVFAHGGDVRFRNGKCPIAGRPCERGKFIALRLDPFRGSLFDLFHGGTDGDGATGFKENGDVIRDGIDEDGRAAKVLRDGRHTAGCKESRTVSCRGGARGSWC